MIHEDALPFLALAVIAVIAGLIGKQKGKNLGFALFCLGGLLPLLSYISNAERLPVPFELEMTGFLSSAPLLLLGAYMTKRTQTNKRKGNVFFWIASATAVIIAVLINLMIFGLARIPV